MDVELFPPFRSHQFSSIDEARDFARVEQPDNLLGNSFLGISGVLCVLTITTMFTYVEAYI